MVNDEDDEVVAAAAAGVVAKKGEFGTFGSMEGVKRWAAELEVVIEQFTLLLCCIGSASPKLVSS